VIGEAALLQRRFGALGHIVDTEIARALNMQIRRLGGMLNGGLEHEYGFTCECGCGEIVQRSVLEFDREGGVWLVAHRSQEAEEAAPADNRR
jgi:hypothetical protein